MDGDRGGKGREGKKDVGLQECIVRVTEGKGRKMKGSVGQ